MKATQYLHTLLHRNMRKKCRTLINIFKFITALCFLFAIKHFTTDNATTFVLQEHTSKYRLRAILPASLSHFSDFIQALTVHADADRYIILAMVDEGFIDMAINFYNASLLAHRVENFLFVGVGGNICTILSKMSIPCYHYADDPSAGKASDFGARDFNRKIRIRTDMVIEALEANFTVISTDTDIAFFRNPLQQLKVNWLFI